MDINPTGTSAAAPRSTGSGAGSASALSSDFDTFLKMLTVQMQNQDPLNPIDSTDYAVQLATFSGVEQQVRTNDLLADLAARMATGGMAEMAGWVGMEARAAVPARFDSANVITLAPRPLAIADRAELVVTDNWGTEVDRREIPVSDDLYDWNGLSSRGTPLPAGNYRFELVSYSQGDAITKAPVEVYARVREIRSENGQTVLILQGGGEVGPGDVTALRDPDLR